MKSPDDKFAKHISLMEIQKINLTKKLIFIRDLLFFAQSRFPDLLNYKKPLVKGVHNQLKKMLLEDHILSSLNIKPTDVSKMLARYFNDIKYHYAIKNSKYRYSLDGMPVVLITNEEKKYAASKIKEISEKAKRHKKSSNHYMSKKAS